MNYDDFLKSKKYKIDFYGIEIRNDDINSKLFDFQKDIVKWSVKKGRCAVFLDTGLGKTFIQLEWARLLGVRTLIIAPLSVARQTVNEGKKINIYVNYIRKQEDIKPGINITNYEIIDNFNENDFDAVVLDESSILKSIGSKTRKKLIDKFKDIKYRLCCTATPAPNDYIEIGNHTEFLGLCKRQEMLAMFFINANKEHTIEYGEKLHIIKGSNKGGQEWRLKHYAEENFFNWMSKWSITMTKPSDLGYKDDGFKLPELNIKTIYIKSDYIPEGNLFFNGLHGLQDRADVRKTSANEKKDIIKNLITSDSGQWIIWCGLDSESKIARENINNSIEVKGKDNFEYKANTFEDFQENRFQVMVTKAKIAGFGMNFQNANNMIFYGLNDSWETYYQAVRRCWRFGQKKDVNVYIILSEQEREIYSNIKRKDLHAKRLRKKLVEKLKDIEANELKGGNAMVKDAYEIIEKTGDNFTAIRGDSCEELKKLKDTSIDLSVYSPPFMDLFTYSNSDRDLGNNKNPDEFYKHYEFIVKELLRVTKEGRLSCVHTSDIPAMANRDGYIGLKDFPGEVLRLHERVGWIFVGRAFIQKNPQAQAIRVKSKSLLFVQLNKDSSHSRPALVDQILIFRKKGDNKNPITPVKNGDLDNETWIRWAHGIWTDINETNTLQYYIARDKNDEKHICPLQLETIERCIKLYSNPGDTVLTPFMGIGSEAFMALKLGRKAVGIELKESYYKVALKNLMNANNQGKLAL